MPAHPHRRWQVHAYAPPRCLRKGLSAPTGHQAESQRPSLMQLALVELLWLNVAILPATGGWQHRGLPRIFRHCVAGRTRCFASRGKVADMWVQALSASAMFRRDLSRRRRRLSFRSLSWLYRAICLVLCVSSAVAWRRSACGVSNRANAVNSVATFAAVRRTMTTYRTSPVAGRRLQRRHRERLTAERRSDAS